MLRAYGWSDIKLPVDFEQLLTRLVGLNTKRCAEEAGGLVRWLRPEFQARSEQSLSIFEANSEDTVPEEAQSGRIALLTRPAIGAA